MPNLKKRNHRKSRKTLLTVPALAITSALLLGVATDRISSTDAAWTDQSFTSAEFSAATLTAVDPLRCFDHESGLLGTSLLRNQLLLTWEPPSGFEDRPMSYRITWDGGLLGAKGEATVSDGSNQYRYQAVLLGQIISLSIQFKVYPIYGSWVGPPATYTAKTISLLTSITMDC